MSTLPGRPASPARRRLLLATLAATLLPSAAGPSRADKPGYSVLEFDWRDGARERDVPVRLYLPGAARRDTPAPLVVFSHGIGGSRSGYSYLGRHWAAQGFASLHLQHVGSDRSLWMGNPLTLPSRLQDAAQEREAIARVADLHFALDRLLASAEGERIDPDRIAAAGHSYGANTTLLAVGASVERDGRRVALRDARLKAAIVISAPPFYGEAALGRVLGAIDVPSLHITSTEDVIRVPGYYSGAEDRIAVFDATGGARKALAVFDGGSHSMFTDRAGTGGAQLNAQVKAATQALSIAFLRQVFGLGGEDAWRAWPLDHRAILARFVGG